VIGDTTGDGRKGGGKERGREGKREKPDMTPDMLRAKNAGAEVIVVWSVLDQEGERERGKKKKKKKKEKKKKSGRNIPPTLISSIPSGYKSCSYDAGRGREKEKGKEGGWISFFVDAIDLIRQGCGRKKEQTGDKGGEGKRKKGKGKPTIITAYLNLITRDV